MDTECLLRDERGLTSAVGLCALMVLILLALAAAQFMRGGSSVSAEYEREMQLRLAAESGIETAAAGLERAADAYGPPPREGRMPIAVGEVPAAENTALSVYIEVPLPGEADGCIEAKLYPDALSKIEVLLVICEQIPQTYALTFENIF